MYIPIWLIIKYWKVFLPFGALAFFTIGANEIRLAVANSHSTTMTVDQFMREEPESGAYHVTGGYLDFSQSVALMDDDSRPGPKEHAESCYIALHSANEPPGSPVRAYYRTADPALMQAAQDSAPIVSAIDAQGMRTISFKPPIYRQLDLTGVILTETSDAVLLRRRLDETANAVDANAVILTIGSKPNIWPGIGMLVMGVLVAIGSVMILLGDHNPFRKDNHMDDDLPTQPGLGSIPYSPPGGAQYPSGSSGYSPSYGQPPTPPYGQAPNAPPLAPAYRPPAPPAYVQTPAPTQHAEAPAPAKPDVPPVFDPFADQQ